MSQQTCLEMSHHISKELPCLKMIHQNEPPEIEIHAFFVWKC